jgi:predicted nucleic acid-binding protein
MVVDASVWVSRLVPQDVHHAATREWLEQQARSGQLFVAPVLALAEVAGAISRRAGRRLARRAIVVLLRVPGLRLVPIDTRLGQSAARLAADLALRGADAVYVAMAHHLNLPLTTWDGEQRERANRLIVVRSPGPD